MSQLKPATIENARANGYYIPGESEGSYGDTLQCNPPHVHVHGSRPTCCCGQMANPHYRSTEKPKP